MIVRLHKEPYRQCTDLIHTEWGVGNLLVINVKDCSGLEHLNFVFPFFSVTSKLLLRDLDMVVVENEW